MAIHCCLSATSRALILTPAGYLAYERVGCALLTGVYIKSALIMSFESTVVG